MPFDRKKYERVQEVLGDPDMYPSELLSWMLKKLSDNPYFAISEIQLPTVESMHKVGDPGEPAFANSWIKYDTTYNPPHFWKDPWGNVHVRGLIKSGTLGVAAFILPQGYRPEYRQLFASISNDTLGRIDVTPDGQVIPMVTAGATNAWYSLDTINFKQFS